MKRKLPPWSRHHEYWCNVFVGRPCNCDDGQRPDHPRRPRPMSGNDKPRKQREPEKLEEA